MEQEILKARLLAEVVVAAAVVALAIPAIRHLREAPPPAAGAVRLGFHLPSDVEPGFADETLDAAIAPDEREIVFVATQLRQSTGGLREGERQLWRRSLDAERAEPIPGTDGAQQPAWKQTGNVIAFFAAGRVRQITLTDGAIHDLADAASPGGATWLSDGTLLFGSGSGVIRRLRDGALGDATRLREGDVSHAFPVAAGMSSDFVYIAIRADGRRVVRFSASGEDRDLTPTSGHAAIVGSHLLHVRDGALLAYARDPESGTLSPRGTPLALNVGVSTSGRALFAASPRLLLHAAAAPRPMDIVWLDGAGIRGNAIADAGDYRQVRLSPDDRFAAVSFVDPLLGALDIALVATDGTTTVRRLTLALAADTDPVWSPDGARVAFRSVEGGSPDVFARLVDQKDGANEVVVTSDLDETPTDWAGGQLLFHARGTGGFDVLASDHDSKESRTVAGTSFNETDARWSPDQRWIALVSDESGRPDVYALSGSTRVRVSFGGGTRPRWTRDGRSILFLRGSQVMRADLAGPGTFTPARVVFDAPGIRDFDVAHRSDRLVALLPVSAADARPQVSAVLNWAGLASGTTTGP